MENIVLIFETVMLICFGISWPVSVVKDIKSKTARGKSIIFTIAIICGYLAGIAGKLCGHFINGVDLNYVLALYILNLIIVSVDLVITVQNMKRDAAADAALAADKTTAEEASAITEGEA